MQFSYLESGEVDSLMGSLLQNIVQRVGESSRPASTNLEESIPDVELSEDWKKFGETISGYQRKYALCLKDLRDASLELKRKRDEMNVLLQTEKLLESADLKESLQSIIEDYKDKESIDDFEETVQSLKGQCKAMRDVLENTNTEQMLKFQCFVCMDRPVDMFMDPCGHLLCSTCWRRSSTTNTMCPGCRTHARPKKMYFLS